MAVAWGQNRPNSAASRCPVRPRFGQLWDFSDSFKALDFVHLVRGRRGRVRSSPVRHREVMMRTLPTTMLHLLNPFVPLFSRRLWPHVQVLLAGAILAPGKRTVSAALRV